MAKKSTIEKNNRRQRMAKRDANKRAALRAIVRDRSRPAEERFAAQLKLAKLPRNGAQVRGAQPLRADRPAARHLPQVRAVPHRAQGACVFGAGARHGEVELVRPGP